MNDLYDLLFNTISKLNKKNLYLNDEDLFQEIFISLERDYQVYLHEWNLDRLIKENLLAPHLKNCIVKLRDLIREIIYTKNTIYHYRYDSDWMEVICEAEFIIDKINVYNFTRSNERNLILIKQFTLSNTY